MNFEDIEAQGENLLISAKNENVSESLTLEFKLGSEERGPTFKNGKLTKDGAKIIAKSLCAFSNSAGGILLIGVNCKKVDGLDCIQELVPIPNLGRSLSSLENQIDQFLQPAQPDMQVIKIDSNTEPDTGYIAISVERSERRPHMSQRDGHYYKRAGTSSFRMEHYDIEDAFRRQTAPSLTLTHEFIPTIRSSRKITIVVKLILSNEGASSARHLTISLDKFIGIQVGIGKKYDRSSLVREKIGDRTVLSAPPDYVVNPGDARVLETLTFEIERTEKEVLLIENVPSTQAELKFSYSISAENFRSQTETMYWSNAELLDLVETLNI